MTAEAADQIVLGAGLRGLGAALQRRREAPGDGVLVVDQAPWPGGSIRTVRTNGFLCELGPFAFARAELEPVLGLLAAAPAPIACEPAGRAGHLFRGPDFGGHGLEPLAVDPEPISFRSGNEELVQACRRSLATALRLGRPVTAIDAGANGFTVSLGGEVPAVLTAATVVIALPVPAAARLLARFDPELGAASARLASEPRAFVWFGGLAAEAPEIQGYGILPAADVTTTLAEVIFCSQVFAGRARPGHFLVRAEVTAPPADDAAVLETAAAELRRWTGLRARFDFTKVHRFDVPRRDGAHVECRVRSRALASRVPGLTVL